MIPYYFFVAGDWELGVVGLQIRIVFCLNQSYACLELILPALPPAPVFPTSCAAPTSPAAKLDPISPEKKGILEHLKIMLIILQSHFHQTL